MASPTTIAVLATLDSKGEEAAYLRDEIAAAGLRPMLVDVGVGGEVALVADISREQVAAAAGTDIATLLDGDITTAEALSAMARGAGVLLAQWVKDEAIAAALGLGGGKGTALIAQAMRALPIGFPKLLVSTAASGNTRRFLGSKDIWIVSPVTDLMGVNRINRRILRQAAVAVCAMARLPRAIESPSAKPALALTSYGVTTPAAERCKALAEELGYEILVFHARGTGGQAMEELIDRQVFAGVLDLTLSELADQVAGGIASAGPQRLEAAGRAGIPQVVAPGALDVVNFGPPGTVPEKLAGRVFYPHSSSATLMRTNAQESADLGQLVATKLNAATGPVAVLIPLGGYSALDASGKPFYDPDANAAFVEALEAALSADVMLVKLPYHVNDPLFAEQMVSTLDRLIAGR